MTQAMLASLVGTSQRAVSSWERGRAVPRRSTCALLAAIFSVPAETLLAPVTTDAGPKAGV